MKNNQNAKQVKSKNCGAKNCGSKNCKNNANSEKQGYNNNGNNE